MTTQTSFTDWLAARKEPAWGSWLMSATPNTAEALGWAGFDFLVVDLEHVPVEPAQAIDHLRAIAATPAQAIVRLAESNPLLIKRALDIGAQNLMLPFVQSADEARIAANASLYPPQGERGVAAMHRASRYTTDADYFANANTQRTLIAQIETQAAIDQLEAIAAVEGINALFAGPGDLAASLGHIGKIAAGEVQEALQGIARRSRAIGIPCGTVAPTVELAQRAIAYGYDFVAVSSDMGFLMGAARSALAQLRAIPSAHQ
ncbi:HpcH/HpaI aldolase/citrate lyase family protein [Niveibacterium sp.]|uniref:HpcH/HpaI aldolase family protein n=1 Tax=Niveibacterium sp. TaxID=2017444 RepID=UPI0035AE6D04